MREPSNKIAGGYVMLARALLDSDLMDQSPLVIKLWVWLLLNANWHDRKQLKRGQLVTTIGAMQEAMSHYAGWRKVRPTPDQIRSAYGALTGTARITVRRTTRGVVITVLNYDTYQDVLSYASRTVSGDEIAREPAGIPHDTKSIKKENRKKETKSKSLPSEAACRLSELLADLVLENCPGNRNLTAARREATLARWAQDIDKLLRIDGRSPEEVERVIRWSQQDTFWKPNIQSGAKLREKFDQLTARMGAEKSTTCGGISDDFKRRFLGSDASPDAGV